MLRIIDLDISFGQKVLLRKGELHLKRPELVLLAGKNGAGKSTWLKTLCGLIPVAKGSITLCTTHINSSTQASELSALVSFMPSMPPQQCYLSVEEVIRTSHVKGNAIVGKAEVDAIKYLQTVGMESFLPRVFESLSDGEKQKVMLARALAQETQILLLDEPLAFLDYPSKIELLELLRKVAKEEKKLVIFSSHDLELSMNLADRMLILDGGEMKILSTEMLKKVKPEELFKD